MVGRARSSKDATIKGLSSIIGDLEDRVGKLEGDAAATATKDAMDGEDAEEDSEAGW